MLRYKSWKNGRVKVLNTSYLDVFKYVPKIKGKVSFMLLDPPYNINIKEWDKEFDFKPFLQTTYDLLSDTGSAVIFNTFENVMKMKDIAINMGFHYRNILIWAKTNPNPARIAAKGYSTSDKEWMLYITKSNKNAEYTYNKPLGESFHSGIFNYSSPSNSFHPTEKPYDLVADLILRHSNPNELMVDLTSGSGAILDVAGRLYRRIIGFELDTHYFQQSFGGKKSEIDIDVATEGLKLTDKNNIERLEAVKVANKGIDELMNIVLDDFSKGNHDLSLVTFYENYAFYLGKDYVITKNIKDDSGKKKKTKVLMPIDEAAIKTR